MFFHSWSHFSGTKQGHRFRYIARYMRSYFCGGASQARLQIHRYCRQDKKLFFFEILVDIASRGSVLTYCTTEAMGFLSCFSKKVLSSPSSEELTSQSFDVESENSLPESAKFEACDEEIIDLSASGMSWIKNLVLRKERSESDPIHPVWERPHGIHLSALYDDAELPMRYNRRLMLSFKSHAGDFWRKCTKTLGRRIVEESSSGTWDNVAGMSDTTGSEECQSQSCGADIGKESKSLRCTETMKRHCKLPECKITAEYMESAESKKCAKNEGLESIVRELDAAKKSLDTATAALEIFFALGKGSDVSDEVPITGPICYKDY